MQLATSVPPLTMPSPVLQVDAALACTYAALICQDEGSAITEDALNKILKAAKCDVRRPKS